MTVYRAWNRADTLASYSYEKEAFMMALNVFG
jgi:hypothetical protein